MNSQVHDVSYVNLPLMRKALKAAQEGTPMTPPRKIPIHVLWFFGVLLACVVINLLTMR